MKNSSSVDYSPVGPLTVGPTGTGATLCRGILWQQPQKSGCQTRVQAPFWVTVCYSSIGPGTQAPLASKARQLTGVSWAETAKIRAPDTCSSSLLGDTGILEHSKERLQR